MNRDGKGAKEESRKPTFLFFFKLFFRKFPQLLTLNLLMIFQVLPIVTILLIYFIGEKAPTTMNVLFAPLYGIDKLSSSAGASALLDMSSMQMGLPVFSPMMTYIIIGLILFMAITWGWQNVGATYVLRGLVRGDAVFVFSDFFYAVKRNLKQGFFLGLIDFAICVILGVDFAFFYQQTGSFGLDFMYVMIFALIIIYFVMRFYIYLLLVTFELKNFKILKNALIFSVLGIKRNILALLGIVLLVAIHAALILVLIPIGVSLTIVIPLIYLMAATAFMAAYAAYPIIDRYMIAPYAEEKSDEEFEYFKEPEENEEDENSVE